MKMSKSEIIGVAADIAARDEVIWQLKNNELDIDIDNLDNLLGYDDLLATLAGRWKSLVLSELPTTRDVGEILSEIVSEIVEADAFIREKGIISEAVTPSNKPKSDKYSILEDLEAKTKEISPSKNNDKAVKKTLEHE
jgi:hypothetical protein